MCLLQSVENRIQYIVAKLVAGAMASDQAEFISGDRISPVFYAFVPYINLTIGANGAAKGIFNK